MNNGDIIEYKNGETGVIEKGGKSQQKHLSCDKRDITKSPWFKLIAFGLGTLAASDPMLRESIKDAFNSGNKEDDIKEAELIEE